MYNIHSHYENVYSFAKTITKEPTLIHFHPFGTTQVENIERLHVEGNNGPILICFDQEPLIPDYNQTIFNHLYTHRPIWRPLILLNTEKDSIAKNQTLEKYEFTDCYYFFHIFAAADWYRGCQYAKDLIPPTERKIKKKFITFNRLTGGARVYRSIFMSEICAKNLFNYGHISYSDICPEYGSFTNNLKLAEKTYNLDGKYINDAIHFLQISMHRFPLRIDTSNNEIPNGSQTIGPHKQLMESFLHVVTETCFWETKNHLTEKIFKPIVARQPFLLLGCAHNLKYLKSYGFKTFDAWWDESYDQIEDPIERIKAVVKIIYDITRIPNEHLEEMLKEMNDILEYNYQLFYSKEFINNAWQELETNLTRAVEQVTARLQPPTFQET